MKIKYAGTAKRHLDARDGSGARPSPAFKRRCVDLGLDAGRTLAFFRRIGRQMGDRAGLARADMPGGELLAELFITQRGRCALTGWALDLEPSSPRCAAPARRLQSGSWQARNVAIVARSVAERSSGMDLSDFVQLAAAITAHAADPDAVLIREIEAATQDHAK